MSEKEKENENKVKCGRRVFFLVEKKVMNEISGSETSTGVLKVELARCRNQILTKWNQK